MNNKIFLLTIFVLTAFSISAQVNPSDEIIKNKLNPLKACELVLNGNNDFYCHHFFERLQKEMVEGGK